MQIDYRVGIPGDATDGGREWESEGVTRRHNGEFGGGVQNLRQNKKNCA